MTDFHPREAALARFLMERGILSSAQAQFFLTQGQRQNQALMTLLCQAGLLSPEAAKQLFFQAQELWKQDAPQNSTTPPEPSPLFVSDDQGSVDLVMTLKDDASRPNSHPSMTPFEGDDTEIPESESCSPLEVEAIFDGPRYEFIEGDQSDNFLVQDLALDKSVLMKLGPEMALAKPFIREALILASLDHPCIPRVLDIGERAGRAFFTLDQGPGDSLGDSAGLGELRLEARLRAFLDICDALHHGGQRGLVHGRLDSCHIVSGDHGQLQVSGWGQCFVLRKSPLFPKVSSAPPAFEASPYTAPELKNNESPSLSADVWSLGALLESLVFDAVLDPIPRALLAVHKKATEPSPTKRYQHAGALADDLRRFLDDERVSAYQEGRLASLRRFRKRHPLPSLAFALSALLILAATGLTVADWLRARSEDQAARDAAISAEQTEAAAKAQAEQSLERLGDFLAWRSFSTRLEEARQGILAGASDAEILQSFQRAEDELRNPAFKARTRQIALQSLSMRRGDWSLRRAQTLRPDQALSDYQRALQEDPKSQEALYGALRALSPSLTGPRDALPKRASLQKLPHSFAEQTEQEARFYEAERTLRRAKENRSLMRQGIRYANSRPFVLKARKDAVRFREEQEKLAAKDKAPGSFKVRRARRVLALRADHSALEIGPPINMSPEQRQASLGLYKRYFAEFAHNPRNADVIFGAFELYNEKFALLQTWRWENSYFLDRIATERGSIQSPSIFFLSTELLQILNQQAGSMLFLKELKRLEPRSYRDEEERMFWLRTRLMRARAAIALGLPTKLPASVQDWPVSLHSEWAVLRAYDLYLASLPNEALRCLKGGLKVLSSSNAELIYEDLARLMADPRVADKALRAPMRALIPPWSINESRRISKLRASYCILSLQVGQRDFHKDLAGLTQSIVKRRLRDHDTLQLYRLANALEWSTYQAQNPYGHRLSLEVWAAFNDHYHREEFNYDCQEIVVKRLKKLGHKKAAEQFGAFDAVEEIWQRRVWVHPELHRWTKRVSKKGGS